MVCPFTLGTVCIVLYLVARWHWEKQRVENLKKKAVFITGCDSGFGWKLALQCAIEGMPVVAGCLTDKACEELTLRSKSTGHNGGRIIPVKLDITKQESVDAAARFAEEQLKDGEVLWAIVNNAGVFSIHGPDDWCTADLYQKAFDVNCLGGIRVTHALKHLVKKCGGRIVSVSSAAGRISLPFAGPYSVAKYGVEAYMDTIRQELYPWGVKCSLLEPGAFRTPLLDQDAMRNRAEQVWEALSPSMKDEYGPEYKDYFVNSTNNTLNTFSSNAYYMVVDNYFHAITAVHPRSRYHCGWDSKLFYIPLCFFPARAQDAVIRFLMSLMNRQGVKIAAIVKKNQ